MHINTLELIVEINNYLKRWFTFPKHEVFAQVTTVVNQQPHIRTMHLYDVTSKGSLIFLTSTDSPKWKHLNYCPNVGACILNLEFGQIIIEGQAVLDTSLTNLPLVTLYWQNYLDEYWRNFYLSNNCGETIYGIPSSFGIVQIIPNSWQILEMNKDDFLKGSRIKYELRNGSWIKNKLPLL